MFCSEVSWLPPSVQDQLAPSLWTSGEAEFHGGKNLLREANQTAQRGTEGVKGKIYT